MSMSIVFIWCAMFVEFSSNFIAWSLSSTAYEFTTLTCIPGTIKYKGAKIQLLDLPGIIEGAKDGKGRGRQIIGTARTCNMLLIVLDAMKPLTHKQKIEKELDGFGIRLNKVRIWIDARFICSLLRCNRFKSWGVTWWRLTFECLLFPVHTRNPRMCISTRRWREGWITCRMTRKRFWTRTQWKPSYRNTRSITQMWVLHYANALSCCFILFVLLCGVNHHTRLISLLHIFFFTSVAS